MDFFNKSKNTNSVLFHYTLTLKLIFFSLTLGSVLSRESILYNQTHPIKFAEVIDLKLNLTELADLSDFNSIEKPFLNIFAEVEFTQQCDISKVS